MKATTNHRALTGNHSNHLTAFVRVGPLMSIPAVLQELGHEPGPIFDTAGLKPAQFTDPDFEIPYIDAGRLLASCEAVTGCPHFGLLVGERAGPSSLGVAGFMLRSAPDVGSALRSLVQHLDLQDQGGVPTLHVSGNVTQLGYAIMLPGVEAADQIYDITMAIACNIMRGLCGKGWNPAEVLLSRRQPQNLAPYKHCFRAPLRFNAEQSAIVFPSRWLDHQIPSADALLYRHLEKEAAELHNLRDPDTDMHGFRPCQATSHTRAHTEPQAPGGGHKFSPRTRCHSLRDGTAFSRREHNAHPQDRQGTQLCRCQRIQPRVQTLVGKYSGRVAQSSHCLPRALTLLAMHDHSGKRTVCSVSCSL
jgi:hypothetical protein